MRETGAAVLVYTQGDMSMGRFTRQELQHALEIYHRARDEASRTGNFSIWADPLTEDAHYIEHAFGEFPGRVAGGGRKTREPASSVAAWMNAADSDDRALQLGVPVGAACRRTARLG
jgi:hypothetical protein